MKKVILTIVAVLFLAVQAEAGLLNEINAGDFVEIINASEPSIAWGTDFASEERVETATVSLITYTNRDFALGSLRAGYSGPKLDDPRAGILALELITPNIVRRFIPEQAKDWKANLKILTLIPSASVFGGYNVKDKDIDKREVYGFTIGPKFTF